MENYKKTSVFDADMIYHSYVKQKGENYDSKFISWIKSC